MNKGVGIAHRNYNLLRETQQESNRPISVWLGNRAVAVIASEVQPERHSTRNDLQMAPTPGALLSP